MFTGVVALAVLVELFNALGVIGEASTAVFVDFCELLRLEDVGIERAVLAESPPGVMAVQGETDASLAVFVGVVEMAVFVETFCPRGVFGEAWIAVFTGVVVLAVFVELLSPLGVLGEGRTAVFNVALAVLVETFSPVGVIGD